MKRIIFVCSANAFRSISAEVVLKGILKEKKIKNIRVSSAGVGRGRADESDIKILRECSEILDFDYLKRRRNIINRRLIVKSDKIIVFCIKNKRKVLKHFPAANKKIFTINELLGRKLKVKLRHRPVKEQIKFYNNLKKLMEKNLGKIIE